MNKWVMWNNKNDQRILNVDAGTYFLWRVGDAQVHFVGTDGCPLTVSWETPEEAATEWEKIKSMVFQDAE